MGAGTITQPGCEVSPYAGFKFIAVGHRIEIVDFRLLVSTQFQVEVGGNLHLHGGGCPGDLAPTGRGH